VPKAPPDALHTLEHVLTLVVSAIVAEQGLSGASGGRITLSLSETLKPVTLPSAEFNTVGAATNEATICDCTEESDHSRNGGEGEG
jgi:hypothetical protein